MVRDDQRRPGRRNVVQVAVRRVTDAQGGKGAIAEQRLRTAPRLPIQPPQGWKRKHEQSLRSALRCVGTPAVSSPFPTRSSTPDISRTEVICFMHPFIQGVRRRILLAAGLTLLALASLHAQKINTDWSRLAIKGYDPVAYFTEGHPVLGDALFECE